MVSALLCEREREQEIKCWKERDWLHHAQQRGVVVVGQFLLNWQESELMWIVFFSFTEQTNTVISNRNMDPQAASVSVHWRASTLIKDLQFWLQHGKHRFQQTCSKCWSKFKYFALFAERFLKHKCSNRQCTVGWCTVEINTQRSPEQAALALS